MTKENCRTFHTSIRTFTPRQDNNLEETRIREIVEIDCLRHKTLRKILDVTNNPDLKWEWRDIPSGLKQGEWREKMSKLNEILIECGLIVTDEED